MKNQNHQQNKMRNGFLSWVSQAKNCEANSNTVDEIFIQTTNSIYNSYSTLPKSRLFTNMNNLFENNKKHLKARERLRAKLEARKSKKSL